jgi:hypothetical protein
MTGLTRLWHGHDTVPLGTLERLCRVLDLHPVELFALPTRGGVLPPAPAEVAVDDAVAEAALVTLAAPSVAGVVAGPVNCARVAEALGWSLARLDAVLASLDDRLAGAGTRVDVDVVSIGEYYSAMKTKVASAVR